MSGQDDFEEHLQDKIYALFFESKVVSLHQIISPQSMTKESAMAALNKLIEQGLVVEMKDVLEMTYFEGDQEVVSKQSLYRRTTPSEIVNHKLGNNEN